jgi:hypothetical protein
VLAFRKAARIVPLLLSFLCIRAQAMRQRFMKRIIFSFLSVIIMTTTEGQKTVSSPVGEYYLRGVMETASGFRLNSDSTFQFFFSYGALDREGQGTWKLDGDHVVLNSRKKPAHDFALVQSKKTTDDQIVINIIDGNSFFLKHVYCIVKSGEKKQEGLTDDDGRIVFERQAMDSVELIFEFCQEKISVFTTLNKDHNHFEFRFEPWMMEVFFENFIIKSEATKLSGPHPLLTRESFDYERAGANK